MNSTPPPILLVRSGGRAALPEWQAVFASLVPGLEVRGWKDPAVDPQRVRYVLVWEPEPGRLAAFPKLELVFSTAAGVDHIVRDPARPLHVPVIRMGAEEMQQTVGEYAVLAALAILRDLPRMARGHAACRWDHFDAGRTARQTAVGVMGLGQIGQVAARMLQGVGFPVHGWSRTPRELAGVRGFAGLAELPAFLAATDILVGILPETPETHHLLNAARLAQLRHGAGLVNAGRGGLVVMPDLLAALDTGQVSMAFLDVFETEPLPPSDPAWQHERLFVTAHVAGYASRASRAEWVARCIADHGAGRPPANVFQADKGY